MKKEWLANVDLTKKMIQNRSIIRNLKNIKDIYWYYSRF
ncbi:Protein of unknown function [Bacillus cytotoxicus]|uniref:Uncharacterized protein n=1 Tax=Bacillus cytotoxicus TaxID=580165 RepID=A0AAX2CFH2_9BACI|nr:Protein of unknown function [Bacillus cytotoxicus]